MISITTIGALALYKPDRGTDQRQTETRETVEIDLGELLKLAQDSGSGNESAENKLSGLKDKILKTTGVIKKVVYDSSITYHGLDDYRNSEGLVIAIESDFTGYADMYYLYIFPLEESLQTTKNLNLNPGDKITIEGQLVWYAPPLPAAFSSNARLCDLVSDIIIQ